MMLSTPLKLFISALPLACSLQYVSKHAEDTHGGKRTAVLRENDSWKMAEETVLALISAVAKRSSIMSSLLRNTLLTCLGAVALHSFLNKFVAWKIKTEIEARDEGLLGTQIYVGGAFLNIIMGKVTLKDISIANPPEFKEKPGAKHHLMRIGTIHVDIDVLKLLQSGDVEIQQFTLKDVEIDVEMEAAWGPDVLFGKSNVSFIQDHLAASRAEQAKLAPKEDETKQKPEEKKNENNDAPPAKARQYILRKLSMVNLKANVDGADIVLDDIKYDDFAKQSEGGCVKGDLVHNLLGALMDTAKASISLFRKSDIRVKPAPLVDKPPFWKFWARKK